MPLGDAALMWSFNRDGEMDERLMRDRDATMGLDTAKKRRERRDLADLAKPQRGVATLADAFPDADGPPPGVRDAGDEPPA